MVFVDVSQDGGYGGGGGGGAGFGFDTVGGAQTV